MDPVIAIEILGRSSKLSIFERVERILMAMPELSMSCISQAAPVGSPQFSAALEAREEALGVATLPARSLNLLLGLCQQQVPRDLSAPIIWHAPSLSTSEKAAILQDVWGGGLLVQKTITVLFAQSLLVLCSSVGDYRLTRGDIRSISRALGLSKSRARHVRINPGEYPPEQEYGLLEGMVSPFLDPGRPTRLSAVVFGESPEVWSQENKRIAISLSPFESLLVPVDHYRSLRKAYASAAYSDGVRWFEVGFVPPERTPYERESLALCT